MRRFIPFILLALFCLESLGFAQPRLERQNDEALTQVLGPRWKQISRSSGMIFSGTVLGIEALREADHQVIPIVKVIFRVDRGIAGVRSGQTINIREWAGAWSQHPLRSGQRVLLFLYPTSTLGLTSPVGGQLGQVVLNDKNIVVPSTHAGGGPNPLPPSRTAHKPIPTISVSQVERAIRSAREE